MLRHKVSLSPPNICYNSYDSAKSDPPYRIYIGSDSHGNMEDQESSYVRWINGLKDGDTNCEYKPSQMNPLLGQINRIIFNQGILSIEDVQSFFNNPIDYTSDSRVKLDFPNILGDNGEYMLAIPYSHWDEYMESTGQNGDIASTYFRDVPNTGGVRCGLKTYYSDYKHPLDYGIIYDVEKRHEKIDCEFHTVGFYISDNLTMSSNPRFEFQAGVKVLNSNSPKDTNLIYISCSPYISDTTWEFPFLKIHIDSLEGGNNFFSRYIINLENIIQTNSKLIGYNKFISLKYLIFKGIIRLSGLVLSNYSILSSTLARQNQYEMNFNLSQNYPNPFNPITKIEYSISTRSKVMIDVYNVLGEKIKELINEEKPPGNYEIKFDGNNLSSGIYFYKLITRNYSQVKKMILLK